MRTDAVGARDLRLLAAVAVLAPLAVLAFPGPAVPPFLPLGNYATYDADTPAALVLAEPVMHAPWLGAPWWPTAVLSSVAVLGALALASRALGASVTATVVVLAAFVSRPDLRALLTAAAPALMAVAGVWGSVMAWRVPSPAWRGALWASALTAAAIALWPPVVVALPVALAAAVSVRRGHGAAPVVGAVVGVGLGLWRWSDQATAIGGTGVTIGDVWRILMTAGDRGTDPFVWPPLAAVRLPLMLMGLGLVLALASAAQRWTFLGGLLMSVVLAVAVPPAWSAEAVRAIYWAAWPLTALGLSRFGDLAGERRRRVAVAVVGLVLLGGGLSASIRAVETEEPQEFAAELGRRLATLGSAPAVFIAEDTRVDTALVSAAGRSLVRLRPSPLAVIERTAAGNTVLAGASARRALELWGLRFAERLVVESPVRFPVAAVTGRFRCVPLASPWRELPGLEYTGRLGVHLPAGQGRFEAVVVSTPPAAVALTSLSGQPRGRVTPMSTALDQLPGVLWPRGSVALDAAAVATRLELDASLGFATSTGLALGERAPAVAVRFLDDARSTGVATVCAAPLSREDPLGPAADVAIALDDPAYFAGGWHAAEGSGTETFRWTARRAVTLVPSSDVRDVVVALDARPVASDGPVTLTAVVNGWPAGTHTMPADRSRHEWRVPASIWVDGTNEIVFEVSRISRPSDTGGHDTRELGMMVTSVRLRRK